MAETKTTTSNKQTHFVLVHGACHGAWCWYKLKPLLEAAGHRATAIDLAASGINTSKIQDVHTLEEYTKPLLELLGVTRDDEKVILVGHSLGGLNLALAIERFPSKVAVGVYLTAFMPDTSNLPSFVLNQYNKRIPIEAWLDTQFGPYSEFQQHLTTMFFGPKFLQKKLYQNCPIEDLDLAKTLVRLGSLFHYDLENSENYTEKGHGSVPRAYIVCDEDQAIPVEFQRWMIENYAVEEVKEIKGADHMAMLSKPQELCLCLSQIALRYVEGNFT